MAKLSRTLFITAVSIVVAGCNPIEAKKPKDSGNFFQFTVDLEYKGQPMRISYPTGCKFNVSRNLDGDRSVDGASLAPSVFGVPTHDGGAIVIKTPNFCDYTQAIDKGEVPESFNPLIIHYENAAEPIFGLGYYGPESFKSPISNINFIRSQTKRITAEDFLSWRQENPNANWVTYDRMNASENIFNRRPWKAGSRHMATVCYGATFYDIPQEVEKNVNDLWIKKEKPNYWILGPKHKEIEYPIIQMSEGRSYSKYGDNGNQIKNRVFPAKTDFDLNKTDSNRQPTAKKITDFKNFRLRKDGVKSAFINRKIEFNPQHEGFLFCDSHDNNHIAIEDIAESFTYMTAKLYFLNENELYAEEGDSFGYGYNLPIGKKTLYKNIYILNDKRIFLYGMGDKL